MNVIAAGLDLGTAVSFTPIDLFQSAMSLAANFWPELLLGLAFIFAPQIYYLVRKAVTGLEKDDVHINWNNPDNVKKVYKKYGIHDE